MKRILSYKSIVFAAVLSLCMIFALSGCGGSVPEASVSADASAVSAVSADEADSEYAPDYHVLVNKENPISTDYVNSIKLVDIQKADGDYYQVETRTAEAFYALRNALLEKGIQIGVDSAYRSVERQQEIMDEFIEEYGKEYAEKTVAIPGTSEHHTGLVIDIVPMVDGEWIVENEDMLKQTEIFAAVHETMPQYGFILRYPEGKSDITGYDYEPWHLRYVGKELAEELYDKQITLEEYYEQQR